MPRYSAQELDRRKEELLDYLTENPEASWRKAYEAGFGPVLRTIYKNRISDARSEAMARKKSKGGISEQEWGERKERLLGYLRQNPEVTAKSIRKTVHRSAFMKFYGSKINKAKEEAGVPTRPSTRPTEEWNEMKREFRNYLMQNPRASFKDVSEAGYAPVLGKFYHMKINDAKEELGIPIIQSTFIPKLSKQDKENIITLASCGITHPILAKNYNVSEVLIHQTMKKAKKEGKFVSVRGEPAEALANAVDIYLTTSEDNIRKKIEEHIFLPMAEGVAKDCLELLSKPIDGYDRLYYGVFGKLRETPKVEEREVLDTALNELKGYIQTNTPTRAYEQGLITEEEYARAKAGYRENIQKEARAKVMENLKHTAYKPLTPIQKTRIQEVLNTLTKGEQTVMRLRFLEDTLFTLEEVGQETGLTRQRIQQLEAKALEKLRRPRMSKRLISIYSGEDLEERGIGEIISAVDEYTASLEAVLEPFKTQYETQIGRYLKSLRDASDYFKRRVLVKLVNEHMGSFEDVLELLKAQYPAEVGKYLESLRDASDSLKKDISQ